MVDSIEAIYNKVKNGLSTVFTPEEKQRLEEAFEKAILASPILKQFYSTGQPKMTKYQIAKAFLNCQNKRDEFYESLPSALREAFFDNAASLAAEELQHILLSQLLTSEQLDDLYYFAYETNPSIEWEGFTFNTLEDYWVYCDQKSAVEYVGGKL